MAKFTSRRSNLKNAFDEYLRDVLSQEGKERLMDTVDVYKKHNYIVVNITRRFERINRDISSPEYVDHVLQFKLFENVIQDLSGVRKCFTLYHGTNMLANQVSVGKLLGILASYRESKFKEYKDTNSEYCGNPLVSWWEVSA